MEKRNDLADLMLIIRAMIQKGFWGEVTVKVEDGKVVLVRKVENIKP